MVSIVFVKTIESLRERDMVRICRSKKEYLIEVSKPTLKREIIVNPEMVIVTHKRQTVFYNKPFYVGFSILDLSKLIMFSWYYEVLKKFYDKPHQVRSIYSDTDSYVLSILTKDLESDLRKLAHTFDFSNTPKYQPLYDESKKAKLFHFKE